MGSTVLKNEVNITALYSAFRYEFPLDFCNSGERHKSWEFVYVESGKISVKADDRKYIIKGGELICHKPMEFHALSPYHSEPTVVVLSFDCPSDKMHFFDNKIISLNHRQRFYLNELVSAAEKYFLPKEPMQISKDGYMEINNNSTDVDSQFIKNALELLILSLYSAESTEKTTRVNLYTQHLKRKALTESIKDYLQKNIDEEISLQKIAEKFSYSVSTIKSVFKQETEIGIIAYYNKLRLNVAKTMLLEKSYSISEISEILNYNSPSHFSNFFKKAVGVSPKDF